MSEKTYFIYSHCFCVFFVACVFYSVLLFFLNSHKTKSLATCTFHRNIVYHRRFIVHAHSGSSLYTVYLYI